MKPTKNNKYVLMALLLLLIVLSVIFYNSFLVEKKDISKKQEPKTYEILKKIYELFVYIGERRKKLFFDVQELLQ